MNVVKPKNLQSFGLQAMIGALCNASPFFLRSVAYRVFVSRKWIWVCASILFAVWPLPGHAKETDLAAEPRQVRALLNEAMTLERSMGDPGKIRRAASLYCKASRFGSIEAQYRLGLLYLSGRGVSKNLDFASALFSQAAQQGHAQALNMLEIVRLRSLKLPPCVI